jgi:hypothetical protein
MKKRLLIGLVIMCGAIATNAQIYTPNATVQGSSGNNNVGIGTTNPQAGLHVTTAQNNIAAILGSAYNHWTNFGGTTGGRIRGSDEGYIIIDPNPNGYGDKYLYLNNSCSSNILMANGGGNVGIGTTTPSQRLDIERNADYQLRLGNAGGLGYNIGRNSTTGYLNFYGDQSGYNGYTFGGVNGTFMTIKNNGVEVNGRVKTTGDLYGGSVLTFQDDARFSITPTNVPSLTLSSFSMPQYGLGAPNCGGSADLWVSGSNGIRLFTAGNPVPRMSIIYNGNVGIDVTNPEYKLEVNGTIHAREVKVDLTGALADFVFNTDYQLMPLTEVEQFVKTNKHLPSIPSATEVQNNGLNMGEMQNKLLQKIEELTLYLIEQQKEIDDLKKQLDSK